MPSFGPCMVKMSPLAANEDEGREVSLAKRHYQEASPLDRRNGLSRRQGTLVFASMQMEGNLACKHLPVGNAYRVRIDNLNSSATLMLRVERMQKVIAP